jgi:hypothetical protein
MIVDAEIMQFTNRVMEVIWKKNEKETQDGMSEMWES